MEKLAELLIGAFSLLGLIFIYLGVYKEKKITMERPIIILDKEKSIDEKWKDLSGALINLIDEFSKQDIKYEVSQETAIQMHYVNNIINSKDGSGYKTERLFFCVQSSSMKHSRCLLQCEACKNKE